MANKRGRTWDKYYLVSVYSYSIRVSTLNLNGTGHGPWLAQCVCFRSNIMARSTCMVLVVRDGSLQQNGTVSYCGSLLPLWFRSPKMARSCCWFWSVVWLAPYSMVQVHWCGLLNLNGTVLSAWLAPASWFWSYPNGSLALYGAGHVSWLAQHVGYRS